MVGYALLRHRNRPLDVIEAHLESCRSSRCCRYFGEVARRIVGNNKNFGGGFIEHNDEQYTLRGAGRVASTSDLKHIVLLSSRGSSVLLRDVASVWIGPMPAHGAVLRNGETVSGMIIMLKGENGKRVIDAVKRHREHSDPFPVPDGRGRNTAFDL